MKSLLFFIVVLILGSYVCAQQSNSKKTIPEGKGGYRWSDGTFNDGQWINGTKGGKGKMVYMDTAVNGERRKNHFMKAKRKAAYSVTLSRNVGRSILRKTIERSKEVKIKILMGGMDNIEIEDFFMSYSSGSEFRNSGTFGIQNASFPLFVVVNYRSWNQLHSRQYDVDFEFTIFEPASWDVMLTNY